MKTIKCIKRLKQQRLQQVWGPHLSQSVQEMEAGRLGWVILSHQESHAKLATRDAVSKKKEGKMSTCPCVRVRARIC